MTLRGVWLVLALAGAAGCGDDGGGGTEAAAGQAAAAGAATAGTSGAAAGTSGGTAGNATSGRGGASAAGSGAGAAATAGSSGDAGAADAGGGGFAQLGVCGQRGEATVNETSFEGFEELYIISEEGFGEDICVVRYDVMRVGEAPAGCDDPTADVDCLWTHRVEFSNPRVITDVDGVCAHSELGLDEAALAEIDGAQAAYGFVSEFAGHNSVIMKFDDARGPWGAYGNANWDEAAGAFRFDRRDGLCGY